MKKLSLCLGDIVILYISLGLTLLLRYGYWSNTIWQKHLIPFSIIFIVWILVFFINGLYDFDKARNDFKFYGQIAKNIAINALLAVLFFYLIFGRFSDLKPQTILLILIAIFAVLFFLWRKFFYQLNSSTTLGNNLALIGVSPESLSLIEEIINKPQLGYKIRLIVNPDHSPLPEKFQIIPSIKDITELKNQLRQHKINTVVNLNNPNYSPEIARALFDSLDLKIQYYNLTNFYEKITGKIPLVALEKIWFLENITQKNNRTFPIAKRLIDIIFALVFGLLSLLIIPFIIIALKLESSGPIIYQQIRVGYLGKKFKVYKFRSMIVDAEKNGAVWSQPNDNRITRVGKFMRRLRIDEIPQFLNILIGHMSFVGPRPERPEFVEQLSQQVPFYNERHIVKPGLTGWAQINYPYSSSVEDAKEKLQYDLFYIKNQSIILDISIILKTINAVFNMALGR